MNNIFKHSISNIAWDKEYDTEMYHFLSKNGFSGIEIAPTRLVGANPYEKITEAKNARKFISEEYGLEISSMQSIWYGKSENIFNSNEERQILAEYTKQAIEFANVLNCNNLVFGCPRNRNIPSDKRKEDCIQIAKKFFYKLGEYAKQHKTIIALEANPPIYNTNFINTTKEAINLVKEINSDGLKVNLDCGTIIYNNEDVDEIFRNIDLINHIHLSEPYLKPITFNDVQKKVIKLSVERKYDKYISVEMGKAEDVSIVKNVVTLLSSNNIIK